jgi:hypothetical protein
LCHIRYTTERRGWFNADPISWRRDPFDGELFGGLFDRRAVPLVPGCRWMPMVARVIFPGRGIE